MAKESTGKAVSVAGCGCGTCTSFFTAVQRGSMAKAAQTLGVTQPAVSKVIAELEHTLGVRLLDRGARGVEPTNYGRALLTRSQCCVR